MANTYMTVESTNLERSVCFSMVADKDIPNGAIVGKGDLAEGETSIYKALDDYSGGMYLVANPAWSYENCRVTDQNEENFVNKAGIPFRVYKLEKDMKFKVGNVATALEKGLVEYKNGAYAKVTAAEGETATSPLKVTVIEQTGFPYCVGTFGSKPADDTAGKYGNALDTRVTKYTIEVVE